jgi:acyl-CoA thioester hydrolase
MSTYDRLNFPAFELPVQICESDIDFNGHVSNITYLRWVQEAGLAHVEATFLSRQPDVNWIILRHEIDYRRSAFLGDSIVARTWWGDISGVRYERHTELILAHSRKLLALARTVICPVDPETSKPVRLSDEQQMMVRTRPISRPSSQVYLQLDPDMATHSCAKG